MSFLSLSISFSFCFHFILSLTFFPFLSNDVRKYNSHEIGSFMEELRLRLLDIKNGNAKEKLSVYSAHDYTLLPLMIGLDISPGDICS